MNIYSIRFKIKKRKWMVVDENGSFLTQRQMPQMALIKVDVENENLVLNAPNMSSIRVPVANTKNKKNCRY